MQAAAAQSNLQALRVDLLVAESACMSDGVCSNNSTGCQAAFCEAMYSESCMYCQFACPLNHVVIGAVLIQK